MQMLILSARDLAAALDYQQLALTMRHALKNLALKQAITHPRHVVTRRGGALGFMAAESLSDSLLGFKVVAVTHPSERSEGTPNPHQGITCLMDEKTGQVKAVLEASSLTAFRTAAMSAAATQELSRQDSRILAVIGAGRQALEHIHALMSVRDLKKILIFNRSGPYAELLKQKISATYDAVVEIVATPQEAIATADIVVTCTASREAFFSVRDLPPGVHVNAVGACRPGFHEILLQSRPGLKIFTDHLTACLEEASEISEALQKKRLSHSALAEMGACFAAKTPGRSSEDEITFFKSVGLGIEDVMAAEFFYHRALQQELGQRVDF